MDAVSDRDFVVEYQSSAAICMMHLSRLAEELVLWSSKAFSFIRLSKEYTTGSSIMPQKQNPDFAELARGKTGRVYGNLFAMLTTLKGLPLTYNRDLQEDKEGLFDTIDTLTSTIQIFTGMLKGLEVNKEKMLEATDSGSLLATDIADYLVSKGLPFREAHGIIAKLVAYATDKNQEIHQLKLENYKQFSSIFESDVLDITIERSVSARDIPGGTALNQVKTSLQNARELIRPQNAQ
jgi:argininosuccinate lyase